jgi:hypothetical protein
MSVPLTVATNGLIQVGGGGGPAVTVYADITSTINHNLGVSAVASITTIVKVDLSDITIEGSC